MSLMGSPQWGYSAGDDFAINHSLRLNSVDDAYLSRTPTSAGNSKTFTLSFWIKRSNLASADGQQDNIFEAYNDNNNRFNIYWENADTTNKLEIFCKVSSSTVLYLITTQNFRDFGAWMHLLISIDTTQGTAANRAKLYVNGTQVTAFSTETYPSQNTDLIVNSTYLHTIATSSWSGVVGDFYYNGYLAESHLIDGTALTPSTFGETDDDYGHWKPKRVGGVTYGTNGFHLNFAGGGILAATGGTITTDGDYKVHSFTADGTFTPTSVPGALNYVEYLVVAGGGGGGQGHGAGGGGAGGYRTGVLTVTAQAYSITVGDGGGNNANGEDSVFSSITSTGGGAGAYADQSGSETGSNGGSGGGGAASTAFTAGTGVSGQGYAGGVGVTGSYWLGGGGGGASAVGTANAGGGNAVAGVGGAGKYSSITGTSVIRAGGGGGGHHGGLGGSNGAAGAGGGGAGGDGTTQGSGTGRAGTANTGGGGGGSTGANLGGAGGSGIVIIRYKFQ